MEYGETIFDEAFVLIKFYEVISPSEPRYWRWRTTEPLELREFYLILNLVTRKPYWIDQAEVEEKIFTMVNESLDQDEEPYHLCRGTLEQSDIVEIKVRPGEIELKSAITMSHDGHDGDDDILLIG